MLLDDLPSAQEGSDPTADVVPAPSMFSGIWTIPNAFTLLRLLCLPVFLYEFAATRPERVAAVAVSALLQVLMARALLGAAGIGPD